MVNTWRLNETFVLVLVTVLMVALWLLRDNPVVVTLQLLGARIHLETKGPKGKDRQLRTGRRSEGLAESRVTKRKPGGEGDVA